MNSANNKESNKEEKQDHGRDLPHFIIVNLKKKLDYAGINLSKKYNSALKILRQNMNTKIKAVAVLMWSNLAFAKVLYKFRTVQKSLMSCSFW